MRALLMDETAAAKPLTSGAAHLQQAPLATSSNSTTYTSSQLHRLIELALKHTAHASLPPSCLERPEPVRERAKTELQLDITTVTVRQACRPSYRWRPERVQALASVARVP